MIAVIAAFDITALVIGLVGGGGVAGMIAVFAKLGPERNQLIIKGTEKAFVIQGGILDDLNEQNERLTKRAQDLDQRVHELEKALASMATLYHRIAELESERDGLLKEVRQLKEENDRLSTEVGSLRRWMEKNGGPPP